jgi:Type I membrane glycoproteins cell-cell fusogen
LNTLITFKDDLLLSAHAGCFLSFLKLSSALCCAVRVHPVSERRYRALNLRVPAVIAQFRTRYLDQAGRMRVLKKNRLKIALVSITHFSFLINNVIFYKAVPLTGWFHCI